MKKIKNKTKTFSQKKDILETNKVNLWKNFANKKIILHLILIFCIIFFIFHPFFSNYIPKGTDIIQPAKEAKLAQDWQKETKSLAFWNPAVFSGLPFYSAGSISYLDSYLQLIVKFSFIFYFLVGSFGFYFLLKYLKLRKTSCFLGAIAFLLLTPWTSYMEAGHTLKFIPVMYIPVLTLFLLKLLDKPNLLNFSIYTVLQIFQIRTMHYQILFYTILFFCAIIIYKIICKKRKIIKPLIFLFISLIIILGCIFQILFLTYKYTPYSIRGGTGEKGSTGLSYSYATSWSFSPKEAMNFIIPRFTGGSSHETYNLSDPNYPQLKNQKIPSYWGGMPFNSGGEYLGIIILFFALIGIIKFYKKPFILTIIIFCGFSLILSFGKSLPILYNLFYNYMPFFNKFRAPSMILCMVFICFTILASYGFNFIFEKSEENKLKPTLISFGILLCFGIISLLLSNKLSYSNFSDANYDYQSLQIIKNIRKEFLLNDTKRLFIFLIFNFLIIYAFIKKYLKNKYIFASLIVFLLIIDLYGIKKRYLLEKINGNYTYLMKENSLKKELITYSYDEFIKKSKREDLEFSQFRIYPVENNFWSTNDYSYENLSIGGYSPAKLRIYQDLIDYGMTDKGGLLRNISDMLSVKYFLSSYTLPQENPFENLKLVFVGDNKNVYENQNFCPKGWFVGSYVVSNSREQSFNLLNSIDFDVHNKAILEENLNAKIENPANSMVKLTKYNPNNIWFLVENEQASLFVVSEVYYPNGWKAYIDGKPTKIYKTNHVLRSIVIPKGKHEVKFIYTLDFAKVPYFISMFFIILSYLLLLTTVLLKLKIIKINLKKESLC